jgi:hypothetical protein
MQRRKGAKGNYLPANHYFTTENTENTVKNTELIKDIRAFVAKELSN